MHVLKFLWSDAIMFACHLVNRMSSSFMYIKVIFLAFILKDMFSLLPWVFGVHIFFRIWLLIWTSYILALSSLSLLATLRLKRSINVTILCLQSILSLPMSSWVWTTFTSSSRTITSFSSSTCVSYRDWECIGV